MKLLVHLLRADLRRLWLLLILWVIVVTAATALEGAYPRMPSMSVQQVLGLVGGLLGVAKLLLMFLIVPIAIQLHPLVGSDAFWMTRPIPPRVLLAVKAMLLWSVIVLIPAAAEAMLMAVYTVPLRTIVFVVIEGVLSQTLWLSLLMVAAALTPTLARFALVCGSAVLALAAYAAVTVAILMLTTDMNAPASRNSATDGTGFHVFTSLVTAAAGLLLLVLFRWRSRLRAVGAGAAGVAVAILVSAVWPWPLLAVKVEVPAWARDPATATLVADPASVAAAQEVPFFTSDRVWRSAMAKVNVQSLPADRSAMPHLRDASVVAGTQVVLRSPDLGSSATLTSGFHALREIAMHLLEVRTLAGTSRTVDNQVSLFFVPDEEFARAGPISGRYDGRFQVSLTKHEIEAVLPLRSGVGHRNGPYRISIERVTRSSSNVAVFTCESRAVSTFERVTYSEYVFFLRNRSTAEGVAGDASPTLFMHGLPTFWQLDIALGAEGHVRGFTAKPHVVRFPAWRGADQDRPPAFTETWLAQAELVILRATPEGSVERRLVIEPFKLEAPGASQTGSPGR